MKSKRTNRMLAALLSLVLLVGLIPTAAFAADNGKAIQMGASAIEKNDTVYYGTGERAWSVLSTNGNDGTSYSDGTNSVDSSLALFLLSKTAWYQTAFGSNSTYTGSTLQNSLLNAAKDSSYFSASEQAAILQTTKNGASTTLAGISYSDPGLSDDTLFALSAKEMQDYLGYTNDSSTWTAGLGGTTDWWLRSAYSVYSRVAGAVDRYGNPYSHHVEDDDVWTRPAFNLNLNSVLFTSAAEGGKSSSTVGAGALTAVSTGDYSEWKLTLKDSSRDSFSVVGTTAVNDKTLTVAYSGATTGENEYISAIVTDSSGNITHYGRIKSLTDSDDASGTVEITLPDGFNSATDTLYLFSEQYNGNKNTDYASDLKVVSLTKNVYTVTNTLTNIETDNSNTFCLTTSDYTATLSVSGDYSLPDSITVTVGDSTLTAGENTYAYDSSTGKLTIYSFAITGDIVITAEAVPADISAPTATATAGGESYTFGSWTSEDVTITVSGSSAQSGIAKYQYSTDGGTNWTDMTTSSDSATLVVSDNSTTADGTSYIFRAMSSSGTEGAQSSAFVVKIDKTTPSIILLGNTENYLQSDTVTVTPSTGLSGVTKVEVSKDGGEAVDITTTYANGYTVTENGTYTFTVTNGAGVTASSTITYSKLDSVKPVVSVNTNGYTSGEWTNEDVTLTVSNTAENLGTTTFQYKIGDGDWQTYTGAITVSTETNGTTYTFRATSASGVVSDEVSVTVKIDKTAPTGEIKVEENSWKSFINIITFGIFCNDKYDVTITADDEGSDVASIEYLLSKTAISADAIASQAGWQTYGEFSLEDEGKYIIYAKITDNAGNVTYLSSNGLVVDKTAPVISGLTNGKIYCGEVTFTVDDEYFNYVTVNSTQVTESEYTLTVDGSTYTVKAYDKAGNESQTYTVTVNNGHTFTDYISDNNATCTEDGTETAQCEYCDATDTRTDTNNPATGHDWGEPVWSWADDCSEATAVFVCGNDASHTETLTAEITEATTAPTETEDGETVYTATVELNGNSYTDTKTAVLPATGTTETPDSGDSTEPTDPDASTGEDGTDDSGNSGTGTTTGSDTSTNDNQTGDTTSPQTGDNSNIALWIALMLAAGAGLTGTILYSRKRKYSR